MTTNHENDKRFVLLEMQNQLSVTRTKNLSFNGKCIESVDFIDFIFCLNCVMNLKKKKKNCEISFK